MSAIVATSKKPAGGIDVQRATRPASPPRVLTPLEPLVDHEIAQLAYSYWEARDCPFGKPLHDWLRAEQDIRKIQKERPTLTDLANH
jgi:hypothetical protein